MLSAGSQFMWEQGKRVWNFAKDKEFKRYAHPLKTKACQTFLNKREIFYGAVLYRLHILIVGSNSKFSDTLIAYLFV
jgi:hypothetical protein